MSVPEPDAIAAILELGAIVPADMPLEEVYTRVVHIARDTIPGAEEVSLTLVREEHPHTAASTGPLAFRSDECQYATGGGPSARSRHRDTTLVIDMRTETRWPTYTEQVLHEGALSSLSGALPAVIARRLRDARIGLESHACSAYGALRPASSFSPSGRSSHPKRWRTESSVSASFIASMWGGRISPRFTTVNSAST